MLVEHEDFPRDWVDWSLLGRKAAAQNLADLCAMGAKPHGLLVSLALPDDTRIADLEALFTGILAEAGRAGAELGCQGPIIGGDLSSSGLVGVAITALGTVAAGTGGAGALAAAPAILRVGAAAGRAGAELGCQVPIIGGALSSSGLVVVAITALGTVEEGTGEAGALGAGPAILRSGARTGDGLYLAGTVGRAAAGLELLFAGLRPETAAPELAALIETQLAPRPDYAAMLRLTAA